MASDVRSGGLKADVIWACDPLTMQDYRDKELVGGWMPETEIPERSGRRTMSGSPCSTWSPSPGKGMAAPRTWPT